MLKASYNFKIFLPGGIKAKWFSQVLLQSRASTERVPLGLMPWPSGSNGSASAYMCILRSGPPHLHLINWCSPHSFAQLVSAFSGDIQLTSDGTHSASLSILHASTATLTPSRSFPQSLTLFPMGLAIVVPVRESRSRETAFPLQLRKFVTVSALCFFPLCFNVWFQLHDQRVGNHYRAASVCLSPWPPLFCPRPWWEFSREMLWICVKFGCHFFLVE